MSNQKILKNPIIPGFYPDPSICRVGKDFYLITSSFSLFPGVPIFHSTDLAHWEQIGNILDRKSQLHLTSDILAGGIMAPTLRYHNGTFYMITSNFSSKGNFIVTATDPAGPWSEPHWMPDATGIDPSLFFDDDGKCYFCGTRRDKNPDGTVSPAIWMGEVDLEKWCLVGPTPTIWRCALNNAASPEAPHIYKKDGWYYVMIAEGGTEHYHAVTIARSRTIDGFYEGYAGNPIMTHRHLGKMYPICNTGHADLVELENGEWYAVMLASRLIGGYHKNLGRETFIAPVTWEDGWPVISPGTGKVEWSYPAPELPEFKPKEIPARDDFNDDKLAMHWVFFGTPYEDFYSLKDSKLNMKLLPKSMISELKRFDPSRKMEIDTTIPSLAFIGRRQQHADFEASVKMDFTALSDNESAGLAVLQTMNHEFRFERSMENGKQILRLMVVTSEIKGAPWMPHFESKTTEKELAKTEVAAGEIYLKIAAKGQDHSFYYGSSENDLKPLFKNADGRLVNPEGFGMVGTLIGMYATSNGIKSDNSASFDWFEYSGS